MLLPPYRLVGSPRRDRNGRGEIARNYSQRYRILDEGRARSVSLQCRDKGIATRRAREYVERAVRAIVMRSDPEARTAENRIAAGLDEYADHLRAAGNCRQYVREVKFRIKRIIGHAGYETYSELDAVTATKAIADLMKAGDIKTVTTANKYREALRGWSRWMRQHGRWARDPLENMPRIKGDTTPTRRRAILTDEQFQELIASTMEGPMRRNLFGEERAWLYLIASQTGLRASELDSLTPGSFRLKGETPTVEIHCTISKRRTTDKIELHPDFAVMLSVWLAEKPNGQPLWGRSRSWSDKAADMLRKDLEAAGIPSRVSTDEGEAIIDFHSFRCYRITKAILTGSPSAVVQKTVRLSTEALLKRYTKLSSGDVSACVNAIDVPKVELGERFSWESGS